MGQIYICKVTRLSTFTHEFYDSYAIVFGRNLMEAAGAIDDNFGKCESVEISYLCEDDKCIGLGKNLYMDIKERGIEMLIDDDLHFIRWNNKEN